jgi:hypothetical protein
MASRPDLDERIEKEFTKHGWTQVRKGRGMLYERPLSPRARERMVHPKKVTLAKKNRGLDAVKHLFSRWFM